MPIPATNPRAVRFGLFELDLEARELRKSGIRIKLHDQPFQILEMLLERPGVIVTREELQKKLWPEGTFVDFDLSLNSAIKKLRQALNDDSENPRFIETLYRRGYRFIAPVNGSGGNGNLQLVEVEVKTGPATVPISTLPAQAELKTSTARKHPLLYMSLPILLLLVGIIGYRLAPSPQPVVLGYTQITHDGLLKGGSVTDGERLYFEELQGDRFAITQVSVAGGETGVLQTPFEKACVADVARNGSALLVGQFQGPNKAMELWTLPLPTGSPRRLGDYVTQSATWSPDGSQLAYSQLRDIFLAKSDGNDSRKLASVGGDVFGLRFSPDGSRLRFEVEDSRNGSSAMWEMRRDGTGLHPLLPGWNPEPRECCGKWTPDGKYYLFQSFRNGQQGIWALPEKSSWLGRKPKPVQLTNGPLDFGSPVSSTDGKRIFAVGVQPRSEVVRSDGKSGFVPFLDGMSASDLAFSSDGQWMAYISIPQHQLWRSRIDGSERTLLTVGSMYATLPRWSPDGKQIVFMGSTPNTGWRAYLISSDGANLREVIPGSEVGYDPGWSPDGKSILLTLNGTVSSGVVADGSGIVTVDLGTGKISPLAGAKQLFSPRWSPDGRYIAAITGDSMKLMLLDRTKQQWRELANMPVGYPSWSHDSQYIYFDSTFVEDASFFRIRVSDGKLERLFSLKGLRQFWGDFGSWTGLGPDDSPLLLRDTGSQEIYAIDWQAP